ncbi:guanylate kinase [Anaerocolumna sedimenticola]|uniref:Guanylate kinase n=1 Tax=Anaerocolumna sedimenticola TaxID=2696063 RepID=A0A6P1TJQ1_9FIRM|nr:guanylate kinase [Anaerocolumna sedimenticola]QHQ60322.1 guanylate kinase [Anaerocolumna sedimenticola]
MSKLFVVMGKSATGKDSIFKKLKETAALGLKSVIGYTTRPIRNGETEGIEYYFVNEEKLNELKRNNKVIEHRAYHTIHGIWNYFTADDGQIDLSRSNYIMIGTLVTYEQIRNYFGEKSVVPIYIEVEDGLRLERALHREQSQENPKYAEMCRRYLADEEDFSEENLNKLNITKRYENKDIEICLNKIIKDIKQACGEE